MPLLSSVGKEIGQQALQQSLQFGDDLLTGKTSFKRGAKQTLSNIGRSSAEIALQNLKRQTGNGRKVRKKRVLKVRSKRTAGRIKTKRVYKSKKRRKITRLSRKQLFGE